MDKKVCYLKDEKTGKFMGSKPGCVNKTGNSNMKDKNKKQPDGNKKENNKGKTDAKPKGPTYTIDKYKVLPDEFFDKLKKRRFDLKKHYDELKKRKYDNTTKMHPDQPLEPVIGGKG
ncbi:hypothetical protein [Candidatus Magnetominusculus dajiuhuensis]|uniref:hypothetical protein n=1 Tax=Candidatus Magnetominusculus dajiuhuensis TaxID=3137712 RepID=UPI003B427F6A